MILVIFIALVVAYTGLFGKGKTLSVVHKVVSAYHRYDGKKVWCPRRRRIVTQRIKVISNVSLSVPYEDFISLEQIVLAAITTYPCTIPPSGSAM